MKLAPFAFLFAFFGFFLSNEYVLFNSELVFIVSFLIFFFLSVEVLGSTIAETLDDREKQIKDEYFSF
jgi:F0F1-type ATP synthase membrane subunit b/b'